MGRGGTLPVHRVLSRQSGRGRISTDQLLATISGFGLTVPWTPALTMMKSDRATTGQLKMQAMEKTTHSYPGEP
jgi:hypothetical protein